MATEGHPYNDPRKDMIQEKVLTGIVVLSYTRQFARNDRVRLIMMTIRKHKEQTMTWQPCAAMYLLVCSVGMTASLTSLFGGRPGQPISEDRRNNNRH